MPLWKANGATLPMENEICWVTNVCDAPIQAELALTDAFGNSLGTPVIRQLAPWQSYDCNVVAQLALQPGQTQDGTLQVTASDRIGGDSCLVADTCRLDDQTIACSQLWVTDGANSPSSCQDYITHFIELPGIHFDLKFFHLAGSTLPVQVDIRDNEGAFLGTAYIPGDRLARRTPVAEMLATIGTRATEGNLYIHLPEPGAAEVEAYTADGSRRSRIPAWCLTKGQIPCSTERDACGVCGGDGSACHNPSSDQLACAPLSQTVTTGGTAVLTARGGSGAFAWSSTDGNPLDGTGPSFNAQFSSPGHHLVTLTAGGQTASCAVEVLDQPGGSPGGDDGGGDDGGGSGDDSGGGNGDGNGHQPLACHLTLSPSTVVEGSSTVLHWAISGAPPSAFGHIDLFEESTQVGTGTSKTGKMPVTPHGSAGGTLTYHGTVYGADGDEESTCERTIRIVSPHGH